MVAIQVKIGQKNSQHPEVNKVLRTDGEFKRPVTGKELIGFHIHDGEVGGKPPCAGFTNFGPIIYFLYTTNYWDKKKTEKAFPLPPDDVTPMSSYVLHLSQGRI